MTLRLVNPSDFPDCPHLHVDRRIESGIDPATDTAWYRDYEFCLDCNSVVERPPIILSFAPDA
jgi:hypothetical protein